MLTSYLHRVVTLRVEQENLFTKITMNTNKLGQSWAKLSYQFGFGCPVINIYSDFRTNLYYPYYFLRVRGTDRKTESLGWARLSNKSYKIECFYF